MEVKSRVNEINWSFCRAAQSCLLSSTSSSFKTLVVVSVAIALTVIVNVDVAVDVDLDLDVLPSSLAGNRMRSVARLSTMDLPESMAPFGQANSCMNRTDRSHLSDFIRSMSGVGSMDAAAKQQQL